MSKVDKADLYYALARVAEYRKYSDLGDMQYARCLVALADEINRLNTMRITVSRRMTAISKTIQTTPNDDALHLVSTIIESWIRKLES